MHGTSQTLLDKQDHERQTIQNTMDHLCGSPEREANGTARTGILPSRGHREMLSERALEPRHKAREAVIWRSKNWRKILLDGI